MNTDREQDLERQLKREACTERPRFSANLHTRIMQAVAEAAVVTSLAQKPTHSVRSHSTPLWAALAASLLIATCLAGWQMSQQARQQNRSLSLAEIQPTGPAEEQPAGAIDNAVDMLQLALDEIHALSQVGLKAQIDDLVAEVSPSVTMHEPVAEVMLALAEVDERTIEQWSDVKEDARLLASFLTGSLPADVVPKQGLFTSANTSTP
jgi:hypothetical protein